MLEPRPIPPRIACHRGLGTQFWAGVGFGSFIGIVGVIAAVVEPGSDAVNLTIPGLAVIIVILVVRFAFLPRVEIWLDQQVVVARRRSVPFTHVARIDFVRVRGRRRPYLEIFDAQGAVVAKIITDSGLAAAPGALQWRGIREMARAAAVRTSQPMPLNGPRLRHPMAVEEFLALVDDQIRWLETPSAHRQGRAPVPLTLDASVILRS